MSVAWGRAEVSGTRSTQRDHDDATVLGGQQQGFRDRASVRLVLLGFGQAVPLRCSVASLLFGGMSLFLFGVVFVWCDKQIVSRQIQLGLARCHAEGLSVMPFRQ